MNSWHSFSPNGRWLVFSSKARSPYTQMYLTHIDEDGNSSPAILVDNTTAANRAVNLPEFVNIPADGMEEINVPAVQQYRLMDQAMQLEEKGENDQALAMWKDAVALDPTNAKAQNGLGISFTSTETKTKRSAICAKRCASTRSRWTTTTFWANFCWSRAIPTRRWRSSRPR